MEYEKNESKNQKAEMLSACEKAAKFYRLQLKTASDANKANSALSARGITEEVIDKFTLGWAPDKYDVLYNLNICLLIYWSRF